MEILEDRENWVRTFQAGWLAHFEKTGETNFKIYNRPKNTNPITGPGIDLKTSRLILITSAGSYLPPEQPPFDAHNPLGDYSLRYYPSKTNLKDLAYAHDKYNHVAVEEDPQVLIPLDHLRNFVIEGKIGSLAESVISFHGYVPDAVRFVDETIPQIVARAKEEQATAALLVPA